MGGEMRPVSGEIVERVGRAYSWQVRLDDGSVLICYLSRSYIGCRVREPERRLPKVGDRVLVVRSPSESNTGLIVRDRQRGITVKRFR
jgi:hypothetical protein